MLCWVIIQEIVRPGLTRLEIVEDFRSLLNTEKRIEIEVTIDTSRFICTELSQQKSRKLDELKRDLNTQITDSISSAIQETILLPLQTSLSGLIGGLGTNVDSRSSRLSRNTEGRKHQGAWGNTQNTIQINSNSQPHSRDSSLNTLDCRGDHDTLPRSCHVFAMILP